MQAWLIAFCMMALHCRQCKSGTRGHWEGNIHLCGRKSGIGSAPHQCEYIAPEEHLGKADALIIKVSFMLHTGCSFIFADSHSREK